MRRAHIFALMALVGAGGVQALGELKNGEAVQGIGTVAQGVQQIGEASRAAVQEKVKKFRDTAGNVYEVLTDATGAATNFVVDAAGTVFDVTKLAGSFFFDTITSYPGDLAAGLRESGEDLRKYAKFGADAASSLGQIAMQARPELPDLKEMLKPSAWKDAAKESSKNMVGAVGSLEEEVLKAYDDLEEEFCTPAKLTPSQKKPGKITMPSFYIEAGLGDCTVNTTLNSTEKHAYNLVCTKPYIKQAHEPGKWVSKHHSAIKFESKECKKETSFGEGDEVVLFEFDGQNNFDTMQMRQAITSAFGSLSQGVVGVADQLEEFLSSVKTPLKGKLSNLGQFGSLPAY